MDAALAKLTATTTAILAVRDLPAALTALRFLEDKHAAAADNRAAAEASLEAAADRESEARSALDTREKELAAKYAFLPSANYRDITAAKATLPDLLARYTRAIEALSAIGGVSPGAGEDDFILVRGVLEGGVLLAVRENIAGDMGSLYRAKGGLDKVDDICRLFAGLANDVVETAADVSESPFDMMESYKAQCIFGHMLSFMKQSWGRYGKIHAALPDGYKVVFCFRIYNDGGRKMLFMSNYLSDAACYGGRCELVEHKHGYTGAINSRRINIFVERKNGIAIPTWIYKEHRVVPPCV